MNQDKAPLSGVGVIPIRNGQLYLAAIIREESLAWQTLTPMNRIYFYSSGFKKQELLITESQLETPPLNNLEERVSWS